MCLMNSGEDLRRAAPAARFYVHSEIRKKYAGLSSLQADLIGRLLLANFGGDSESLLHATQLRKDALNILLLFLIYCGNDPYVEVRRCVMKFDTNFPSLVYEILWKTLSHQLRAHLI